jgi:hypothetical protein
MRAIFKMEYDFSLPILARSQFSPEEEYHRSAFPGTAKTIASRTIAAKPRAT